MQREYEHVDTTDETDYKEESEAPLGQAQIEQIEASVEFQIPQFLDGLSTLQQLSMAGRAHIPHVPPTRHACGSISGTPLLGPGLMPGCNRQIRI